MGQPGAGTRIEPTDRTVLIVDDHRSFAEALAIAVDTCDGLRCVAIAGNAADGYAAALRTRPDIVLVDMHLPDEHGRTLITRLRQLPMVTRVLALTAYADAANVAAAAQAGACGFLRKECSVQDILTAITTAGEGPLAIDAHTLGAMLSTSAVAPVAVPATVESSGDVHLTPREREVLGLLATAHDAVAIARRLEVSIHTVRGYVKALLGKLDAHSQLEAVVRARDAGLLPDPAGAPPPFPTFTLAAERTS